MLLSSPMSTSSIDSSCEGTASAKHMSGLSTSNINSSIALKYPIVNQVTVIFHSFGDEWRGESNNYVVNYNVVTNRIFADYDSLVTWSRRPPVLSRTRSTLELRPVAALVW
ncbi:uncharacterized protein CLUP02_18369 [Colletotrichum lupini]|uniref:Uncharacterized protein n=1 Tax=Colletotrichum lupini TaxID=145971 RepID=A0A9Q8WB60_9PEZI|nr:uncharacterized protein CLUP02_18369 [Colletotrichum lupini]UQC76854.1 hypothetical protein CLUP02_18369 [Colletotrichum lupini]